jgi:hypothetical protein
MNLENHEVFTEELNQISDEKLRGFVAEFLDTTIPKYFYHVPASSSGKYHPKQDLGEGGLVRHTKAVVRVALDLLRCEQFVEDTSENRDIAIISCLLHDTFKNGIEDSGYTVSEHPLLASEFFSKNLLYCHCPSFNETFRNWTISSCIESHMGIWNKDREGNEILPKPETEFQKLVHMADYIASRKYINFEDLVGENK